jgi:HlyD family secretion protein
VAVRKRAIVWGVASCVLIGGVSGFFWWRARNRKPQYVTAQVAKGNLQRTVSATGALNPIVTVQVGSYVSGTVKSLACDFNTEVVVGQVCAIIDPVPFQLIVDEDKAQVGTAVAQLKKDTAALRYAKLAFERDSKLLKENTVSQDTVDNDESVYNQAQEQLGLDQANIVDKQAALKAAQVNLAYTNIVSPVIGTVITRAVDVGQTVAASLASPTVFLIGKDLTHMQVDTNVSEADVGDVRLGQDANFTVQAFPGKAFKGKVTQIRRGPITVQNVVTYDVVIAVDNPDRKLFPGMTADAHIVIDERDDILKVPLPAVRFTPEGVARGRGNRPHKGAAREVVIEGEARSGRAHRSRVWVLSDAGELRPVQVQTGIDDGSVIEVSGEGLSESDKVVINEAGGDARDRSRPQTGPGQGAGLLRAQGGGGQGFRP